jgi:hypothetical protein
VISHFGIDGIPPFRQEKGERMGHGIGTKTYGQGPRVLRNRIASSTARRLSATFESESGVRRRTGINPYLFACRVHPQVLEFPCH